MAPETTITCVSPMEIMIEYKPGYVLGFLFLNNRKSVVLIRKNKPESQAGKLNGVGGQIEPGELPLAAMVREFSEEAGKVVSDWRQFAVMEFPGAVVYCFTAYSPTHMGLRLGQQSLTEEQVNVYFTDWTYMSEELLPNLHWLVPMALSEDGCPTIRFEV